MTDFAYLTIRNIPKSLHAALTKLAAANRRSINAEVIIAIEGHVASANFTKGLPSLVELEATEVKRFSKPATKRAKGKR